METDHKAQIRAIRKVLRKAGLKGTIKMGRGSDWGCVNIFCELEHTFSETERDILKKFEITHCGNFGNIPSLEVKSAYKRMCLPN